MSTFAVGDRVVFRLWGTGGWGRRWSGVILETANAGALLKIEYHYTVAITDERHTEYLWRRATRVKLTDRVKALPADTVTMALPKATVDILASPDFHNIIQELLLLKQHFGSTNAVLDTLKAIREGLGTEPH